MVGAHRKTAWMISERMFSQNRFDAILALSAPNDDHHAPPTPFPDILHQSWIPGLGSDLLHA